jgi:hypothetical protein
MNKRHGDVQSNCFGLCDEFCFPLSRVYCQCWCGKGMYTPIPLLESNTKPSVPTKYHPGRSVSQRLDTGFSQGVPWQVFLSPFSPWLASRRNGSNTQGNLYHQFSGPSIDVSVQVEQSCRGDEGRVGHSKVPAFEMSFRGEERKSKSDCCGSSNK